MRIDLRLQEIQLCRKLLVFYFLLSRFKFKPVDCKAKHSHEDDDKQRDRHTVHDKQIGIEIPLTMRVAVDEITLKMNTHGDQRSERNNEFQQVAPDIFPLQKAGEKIEIIQVNDNEREDQLYRCKHQYPLPVKFVTLPLAVADLVDQKRDIHAPEKEVQ